jgi:hypothetical protein
LELLRNRSLELVLHMVLVLHMLLELHMELVLHMELELELRIRSLELVHSSYPFGTCCASGSRCPSICGQGAT